MHCLFALNKPAGVLNAKAQRRQENVDAIFNTDYMRTVIVG